MLQEYSYRENYAQSESDLMDEFLVAERAKSPSLVVKTSSVELRKLRGYKIGQGSLQDEVIALVTNERQNNPCISKPTKVRIIPISLEEMSQLMQISLERHELIPLLTIKQVNGLAVQALAKCNLAIKNGIYFQFGDDMKNVNLVTIGLE